MTAAPQGAELPQRLTNGLLGYTCSVRSGGA